ncbi:MAG: exodeoxyribonuclease VII large subunit [Sediminispirochaetaceae bacterium]
MEHVYRVSEINSLIKEVIETSFPAVAVEGEISNFRPASSGHWYFSLKDEETMIQAVMFRHSSSRLTFTPKDGDKVVVRGNLGVYPQRGVYQIVCKSMEQAGTGNILAMLERRKKKLASEGLFDEERKKPLPIFPRRIAVVTSPSGAALRDILNVLGRRSSGLDVVVLPAPVQGEGAAEKIAAQIRRADTFGLGDVIIVGRGGGSLEDLLPFSEEAVVRAVYASNTPVISAVGHQTDTSLSDYAADRAAPTPSAAAELVSSSREELYTRVISMRGEMERRLRERAERARLLIERFTPENLAERFRRYIQPYYLRLDDAKEELIRTIEDVVKERRHGIELLLRDIEAASPEATLRKGYALVTKEQDGALVRSYDQVTPGEMLDIRVASGRIESKVTDAGEDERSSVEQVHEPTAKPEEKGREGE